MEHLAILALLAGASFVFTLNVILHLRLRRQWRELLKLKASMEAARALMHCVIEASWEHDHQAASPPQPGAQIH